MKVLITGGAGYLGTQLTYALAANDKVEQVVIYDNLSRPNHNLFIGVQKLPKKVSFVQGDILDSRKLRASLKGIDVVYHLAAKVTTPLSDESSHLFEQVNHWGTAELTYALEQSDVSKFIYLSSASVYGTSSDEVDVDAPLNPSSFYGISKMRGEEHVRRLMPKLTTYIVRCGNVYGYNKSMRFDSAINRFLFDANFSGRITVRGDGTQHRSFIHIDKVGKALSSLPFSELKSNRFDLVDRVMRINDVIAALQSVFPEMEMLFINQHLQLREIKVKANPVINAFFSDLTGSFEDELAEFKEHFSFQSSQ